MQSCYECHKVMLQNVQVTSGLSILMPEVISHSMPPTSYDKTYIKILYNEFSITQILTDQRQSPDKQKKICVIFSLSIRGFFWVATCFPLRNKKNNFTHFYLEAWKYPLIKLGHTKLGIHWIQIIGCISVYIFAYYLTICIESTGPESIKLFSYSTHLSRKFQLLIKTKIPTNKEVSCFKSLRCCIYHANKC